MLKMISYTLFFTYQNNEALSTPATFDNISDNLYFYVSFQKKRNHRCYAWKRNR